MTDPETTWVQSCSQDILVFQLGQSLYMICQIDQGVLCDANKKFSPRRRSRPSKSMIPLFKAVVQVQYQVVQMFYDGYREDEDAVQEFVQNWQLTVDSIMSILRWNELGSFFRRMPFVKICKIHGAMSRLSRPSPVVNLDFPAPRTVIHPWEYDLFDKPV